MAINAENVKTILRNVLTGAVSTPLIQEGTVAKPQQNLWILEKYKDMEKVYATETIQLLKGEVCYTVYSRDSNSPATIADLAAAAFDPALGPAQTTTMIVFMEKVIRTPTEQEAHCRKCALKVSFTACLKS